MRHNHLEKPAQETCRKATDMLIWQAAVHQTVGPWRDPSQNRSYDES
jgi:hypothetical protein